MLVTTQSPSLSRASTSHRLNTASVQAEPEFAQDKVTLSALGKKEESEVDSWWESGKTALRSAAYIAPAAFGGASGMVMTGGLASLTIGTFQLLSDTTDDLTVIGGALATTAASLALTTAGGLTGYGGAAALTVGGALLGGWLNRPRN